ncbi:hypothetical protein [Paraliomyxa miuraensis]|uniref:hypothetical protein n=1 Tax=Paraliomyxa miuraensis TaxID=376150 RepID=UPI002258802E|nr:hypothetical protein [Paraliomyxa miuraensis]MCX4241697.1 hypothetical protein [Paraliomyxa miuraensis]
MDGLRLRFFSLVLPLVVTAACGTDAPPGEETSTGDDSTSAPTSMTNGTTPTSTNSTSGSTTTPATSTTVDPTDSADSGSTTMMFVGIPDMPGGGECDVFAQDCPVGEKCMPWANDGGNSWNATTCSPVMRNPGQVGDPCTVQGNGVSGIDDCDLGAMCYNVSFETNMGTCFELCHGSPEVPECDDGLCAVYNDGNLPLCLTDCDPLLQDCPGQQLCLASPSVNGFVCILDALPAAMGDYGAPCTYVNDCDPGYFCAIPDIVFGCGNPTGCCAEFCDISAADPSSQCTGQANGEECLPWYGMDTPPPGYEDVGFCGLP